MGIFKISACVSAGLAACLALLLSGGASAQEYPPVVTEMIERARAEIRTMDMKAFKSSLDHGEAGLIVDVREPGEFADGHIAGAINIPRGLIELKIWPHVGFPERAELDRRITVYCGSGLRCVLAAKTLQDLGFRHVTAVAMTLNDWVNAGFPLVKD